MSNDSTQAFKFSRDFRKIMWGATLWHNVLRAACAGLVWAIVSLVAGSGLFGKMPPFSEVIVFPIVYVVGLLPLTIALGYFGQFFWPLGLMATMLSLTIVVGDPLVWLLSRFVPNAVPTKQPGFLNFTPVMWILRPDTLPSEPDVARPPAVSSVSAPDTNGKVWLGSTVGNAYSTAARYAEGYVWLGTSEDNRYSAAARYADGFIWLGSSEDNKYSAAARYAGGYIWRGSSEDNKYSAAARYSGGCIWLGASENNPYSADARYEGSDDGAAAAAFLLLLAEQAKSGS